MMSKVNVSDLQAGMVLAADAVGMNGRLLLPGGTELQPQHLKVLKMWGAVEVSVVGVSGENARLHSLDAMPEDQVGAAQEYVDSIFSRVDLRQPPMATLRSASLMYHAKRLHEEGIPCPECPEVSPMPSAPAWSGPDVQGFVAQDDTLASFPDIYFKIRDAMDDPNSTATRLADVIAKDPGISVRLLSLVNSPFYGFPQRIDSLSRGVALVGGRELSQLALGVTVMDVFSGVPDSVITMRGFWQHSVACGVVSRILAAHGGMQQERCFVIGLLHDVGRLFMLKQAPAEMTWVLVRSRTEGIAMHEVEKILFGFDHTDVANALFKRWNLPQELRLAVTGHHSPKPDVRESAVCIMADAMTIAMGHGTAGTIHVHDIPHDAWAMLGVSEAVLTSTMEAAARQIDDILTVFLG